MDSPPPPLPMGPAPPVAVIRKWRNDPYGATVLPQLQSVALAAVATTTNPPPVAGLVQQAAHVLELPSQSLLPLPPVHHYATHPTQPTNPRHAQQLPNGFAWKKKHEIAHAAAFEQPASDLSIATDTRRQLGGGDGVRQEAACAFVRFKHETICYRYPTRGITLRSGDFVVVSADRGINVGMVERVTSDNTLHPVSSEIARLASPQEVMALTSLRLEERDCAALVQRVALSLRTPMQIVDVEFQFDRNKLTVYYESQSAVDFRRLQRVLFKEFGCRIWLVLWRDIANVRLPGV